MQIYHLMILSALDLDDYTLTMKTNCRRKDYLTLVLISPHTTESEAGIRQSIGQTLKTGTKTDGSCLPLIL